VIHFNDIKASGFVDLWDLGPEKPTAPAKPVFECKAKEGTPDYDVARAEFKETLEKYEADLAAYRRSKREFDHWHQHVGGPKKVEMWPVDARTVLERQANGQHSDLRYHKHLPKGMRPGKAQVEAEERAAAEAEARKQDMDRDPHFGKQPGSTP
jgi:hypothetical protein